MSTPPEAEKEKMVDYRLGLDLGTNSIGWCALELNANGQPIGVLDAGVRIQAPNEEAGRDSQSKVSLAANRRAARVMRRRRDRFTRRRERLMGILVKAGLMPADQAKRKALEALDPYWLRREALDQRLEPYEIGRTLFHLNQRRGFRSNRIADSGNAEQSAMKSGVKGLETKLKEEGVRTLGELLAGRHQRDKYGKRRKDGNSWVSSLPIRFRPTSQGRKNLYDFYPTREMIEAEINEIWEAQRRYHPRLLRSRLRENIKRIVIDQRPLKKPRVGRCTLRPEPEIISPYGFEIDLGTRAPKAHPLFQRFRILQDVCQLRIRQPGMAERHLTLQERDTIAVLLTTRVTPVLFERLRTAIKLPDDARFNYELSGHQKLQPDQTSAKLASRRAFGGEWREFPRERQIEIVERLLGVEDEVCLQGWLQNEFSLDKATAETISEARLPQGHGQFGRAVLHDLVGVMERRSCETADPETGEIYARPLIYNEAVECLDLHHSHHISGERRTRLPYYGAALSRHVISQPNASEGSQEHIGRVPNPTVHIGLNQLRKVVNMLIETYGRPKEIVVELARELKLNKQRKDKIRSENKKNKERNDQIRQELECLSIADTYRNRLLLRLYHELSAGERVCVYTGTPISKGMLFSGAIEIDHILAYSRTLDDGFMNKVLCTREAIEALKGDRRGQVQHPHQRSVADLFRVATGASRAYKGRDCRLSLGGAL